MTSSAHQPRRDDEFDRWLKAQRDIYKRGRLEWYALDCVIDLYRLHADTGTPLGERACACRATEDCTCLEDNTGGTP